MTTISYIRACGPSTLPAIANEIRIQATNGTRENCERLAILAVNHGIDAGWLEKYDDKSFCIA